MNGLALINGRGDEYNLFDDNKSPAFAVEGLGYGDETDFLRIGNTYHALSEISSQRSINLALSFYGEADKRYRAFVDFARRDPLMLRYTNDVGQYYIPCRLRTIEKPDQPRYRQYICPVSFVITGNPYEILSAECKAGETVEGKVYPYTYDYVYSGTIANSMAIKSGSYVNSACILTIYGSADAPIWRHYLNGELVETGAYSGTIPAGNRLVIDSRSMPQSIIEYDAAGMVVADRYQLCDFSTERFMHVGEGDNRYVLSHNGVTDLAAKVEAYIEYEAI